MKQFPIQSVTDGDEGHWKRLSLGAGVSVPTEEILGIFDMDTATVSPITKKFLNTAQKRGCVSVAGEELPKSFVVRAEVQRLSPNRNKNDRQPGEQVVLSQFAPTTLVGRGGSI